MLYPGAQRRLLQATLHQLQTIPSLMRNCTVKHPTSQQFPQPRQHPPYCAQCRSATATQPKTLLPSPTAGSHERQQEFCSIATLQLVGAVKAAAAYQRPRAAVYPRGQQYIPGGVLRYNNIQQYYYSGGKRNVLAVVPGATVQIMAKQNSDAATLSR